jgi:hypothetical protein
VSGFSFSGRGGSVGACVGVGVAVGGTGVSVGGIGIGVGVSCAGSAAGVAGAEVAKDTISRSGVGVGPIGAAALWSAREPQPEIVKATITKKSNPIIQYRVRRTCVISSFPPSVVVRLSKAIVHTGAVNMRIVASTSRIVRQDRDKRKPSDA